MDFGDLDRIDERLEKTTLTKEEKRELKRRWRFSLWRILPLPVISYTIVGTYLWSVGTPDAWERAAAPVIAVLTFTTLSPFIRNAWYRRTKQKIVKRNRAEERDGSYDD